MSKRGTDHRWQLIEYKGDMAIYARCKCKYHYDCSRSKREEDGSWSIKQYPTIFYPYCPCCGARKKYYTDKIEKVDIHEFEDPSWYLRMG